MKPPIDRSHVAELSARLSAFGDSRGVSGRLKLLDLLYSTGRCDLPLGRIFEGHVDALRIVARFGSPRLSSRVSQAVQDGAVLGMWNADDPGDPLHLEGGLLRGGKVFASGIGVVTHALVTFDLLGERQLLLIDLERSPPIIDTSWWQVTGMQRSNSHRITWQGSRLIDEDLVGEPGDYVREPWFSGGALRFAAVQAGGIAALFDLTREHLMAAERATDPIQAERLADLFLVSQSAADAVASATRAWDDSDIGKTLARVAVARTEVYRSGETAMALSQAAVGVQAQFLSHPLAERLADLSVYLRQPAPDAQRRKISRAVIDGVLKPELA